MLPPTCRFFLTLLLILASAAGRAADDAKAPPAAEKKAEPLTPQALDAIWTDLTKSDEAGTKKAYQDICRMVQAPQQAVPFLKARLRPVEAPDPKRIDQWIADLDSNTFGTREKATAELERVGPLAAPALTKKLKEQLPSLEVRRRMERILEKQESHSLSPDELRAWRAVEVLEMIGTAEARAVLETLAKGAPGAVQTEDAKKALARLGRRTAAAKP